MSYAESMKRLEEIVAALEAGGTELNETLKLFEKGSKLLKKCQQELADTKAKSVNLKGSDKSLQLSSEKLHVVTEWQDPHDELPWSKKNIVQNIEIKEDGEVTITVKPTCCPCCLLDLDAFRTKLLQTKVSFTT